MGDWVKDQFLNKPIPDPWVSFTVDELRATSQDLNNPREVRERMRIVIKARQQGKRASVGKSGEQK